MDFITGLLWLSLTVYFESRGEDKLTQIAVAHTTANRARVRNKSIRDTVLEPHSYEWVAGARPDNIDVRSAFSSMHSAIVALQGFDFTGGADHFHDISVLPKWSYKMTYVGRFGKIKFYKPLVKIKPERRKIYVNLREGQRVVRVY